MDPRISLTYFEGDLHTTLEIAKTKFGDEAKYQVKVEEEDGAMIEVAGFSVFIKDPKDSGLDFRSLLRHK